MANKIKPKNRQQFNFCVDPSRLSAYKKEAKRHNLMLAAWIRLILDREVKERSL